MGKSWIAAKRFEGVLALLPDGLGGQVWFETDAERLIAAAFGGGTG
ncbi:hypothetical protein NY78_1131 [Desulfovibrio sp. TomC]|nr:hypothetical protein NY78_1131 [Desulfovibrio sp. TomC]